ncbi:MAG: hypothetical protein KH381_02045 [Clostridium sp.]|nr:hypothetical protein [Clostridium sp.]
MATYADVTYYKETYKGTSIPDDALERALRQAERHIDTLTYNRIVGAGFERLTTFQRDIIREVCCNLADFEYENADELNCILQNYAINGVSMTFGSSWNMVCQNGVAIRRDLYEYLSQTGLCCLSLGV